MHQVHPQLLWIGHAGDSRGYDRILEIGIKVVVQLALEEPPLAPPRELVYLRFPLIDGGGDQSLALELAIETAAGLITRRVPTLICCGAGMSRAPAVAAAALARASHEPLEECLARVTEGRPGDVSPGFWAAIVEVLSSSCE